MAILSATSPAKPRRDTFVFIEIFSREGGIQSYIQDVLLAYAQVVPSSSAADIFLLRDRVDDIPAVFLHRFRLHCFQSRWPMMARVKLGVALLLHLLTRRPRHIFCGHINLAALVYRLSQWTGIAYTVMTYGKEVWFPLKSAEQTALRQANRIWTISRYSRDLACATNQIDRSRVDLLPCIVDESEFQPGAPSQTLRKRYCLENSRVLMTVARLWKGDPYKGVDVTIRALPAIAKAYPNVKYLVIGRGDDQPRLAQLAQELGVTDRVIFAGFVPTDQLVDHYRLADVYVMPSKEGFGIVYLEAMACGIPVIAGDEDGSRDPLQDGRLGWQVPHRDPAAVGAACIEALAGEDQRCSGTWLREQTIEKFGRQSLARRLQTLLDIAQSDWQGSALYWQDTNVDASQSDCSNDQEARPREETA